MGRVRLPPIGVFREGSLSGAGSESHSTGGAVEGQRTRPLSDYTKAETCGPRGYERVASLIHQFRRRSAALVKSPSTVCYVIPFLTLA